MSEWQPIETAPPNTDVLVWWPIVEVDENGDLTDNVVDGQRLVSELQGDQWLEPSVLNCLNSNAFDDDAEYAASPTHWQSLPDAPAEQIRKEPTT